MQPIVFAIDSEPSMMRRHHGSSESKLGTEEYEEPQGTPIPRHEPDDDAVLNRLFFHH